MTRPLSAGILGSKLSNPTAAAFQPHQTLPAAPSSQNVRQRSARRATCGGDLKHVRPNLCWWWWRCVIETQLRKPSLGTWQERTYSASNATLPTFLNRHGTQHVFMSCVCFWSCLVASVKKDFGMQNHKCPFKTPTGRGVVIPVSAFKGGWKL